MTRLIESGFGLRQHKRTAAQCRGGQQWAIQTAPTAPVIGQKAAPNHRALSSMLEVGVRFSAAGLSGTAV